MPSCVCGSSQSRLALRKDGFDIVKCADCGTGRTIVSDFDPALHYNEGYFNGDVYPDYKGSQDTLRREFRSQANFLKSILPNGGKLLEVGCAYGFFLQETKAHFVVYGFEMAQAAVDFCHQSGLPNVQQGAVSQDYLDQHGPFDAIVMLDTIEHIEDVRGTATMLAKHLTPGGVFLVTTGDWDSGPAKRTGLNWRLLTPPLHLWFFTPKGLTAMFADMGLRCEHFSRPWKLVPLELVLTQAAYMLGINWRWKLPSVFSNLPTPSNMFDAMRLVFRKF